MNLNEAKAIVLGMYPAAVNKKIGVDNGSNLQPFYVVFKCNSISVLDAISPPCKKQIESWISAASNIINEQKDKV